MRGLETLFFAALLGLLGLGAWTFRDWFKAHSPISAPAVSTFTKPTPPAVKSSSSHTKAKVALDRDFMGLPGSTSVVTVLVPSPRFPEPRDIPTGISGAQILANFGEPSARVTRADQGRLFEQYYYVNQKRTLLTTANLQDGRVVSAREKPL